MDLFVTVNKFVSLDESITVFVPLVEGFAQFVVHLLGREVAHHKSEGCLTQFCVGL